MNQLKYKQTQYYMLLQHSAFTVIYGHKFLIKEHMLGSHLVILSLFCLQLESEATHRAVTIANRVNTRL